MIRNLIHNLARRGQSNEHGAVMVLVAAGLSAFVMLGAFVVDVGHWYDYSRNLQNRADASALAAGLSLGSCLGGSGGASSDTGIEDIAQQYAGPPDSQAHLPYSYILPAQYQPYQNVPNLTTGKGNDFWMVLNGATSHDKGGMSFTDGHVCSTDYTSPAGPAVDVWLTQMQLPQLFPLIPYKPNISAHARVQLQGEGSSPFVRPIAVSDPGAFGCATVKFINSVTGATIATRNLTETDPANFKFDNAANPVSVPMPSDNNANGANAYVYMQVILSAPDDAGNCPGSNGETFDDSTNSGIEVINSYGTATPASGQAPKITNGGIALAIAGGNGATCNATNPLTDDQYFSTAGCTASVTAHVTFSPDVTNANSQASVTATDTSTGQTVTLHPDNTGTIWTPNGNQGIGVTNASGQNLIRIDWSQSRGTVGGQACSASTPCTGTFGIQQQSFGACNGCDQPDDSGPVVVAKICDSVTGFCNTNAFQQTPSGGTAPSLVVKLQLAGIRAQSGAAAPDTILRFSGSTNHQTGLVDCGQGNQSGGAGTSADAYTIYGGCGPNNPFEPPNCTNSGLSCPLDPLDPLFVYGRGNPVDCSPMVDPPNPLYYTGWPSNNHQDCVQTTPGTRRVGIVCGLLQRITGVTPTNFSTGGTACNSNNSGTCPVNYWPNYNTIPDDPRKIDVVLVAPVDLAAASGSPQSWIPIRRFARFYVTGWDPALFPKCGSNGPPNNDPFPGQGKQSSNGAIWGHWITDVDPGGSPDGNPCPTGSIEPVTCVPALTR